MRMSEGLQRDYPFEGNAPGHVTLRMQVRPSPTASKPRSRSDTHHRLRKTLIAVADALLLLALSCVRRRPQYHPLPDLVLEQVRDM